MNKEDFNQIPWDLHGAFTGPPVKSPIMERPYALMEEQADALIAAFDAAHMAGGTVQLWGGPRLAGLYLGHCGEDGKPTNDNIPIPGTERVLDVLGVMLMHSFKIDWRLGHPLRPSVIIQAGTPESEGSLWHSDFTGWQDDHTYVAKINAIVQLSRSSDYDGGDLDIYTGNKIHRASRDQGTVVAFPNFLVHRRLPVTRGRRVCMVLQGFGPGWR